MLTKTRFDFAPKTKAFPHQIDAIDAISKADHIALFDEQGLGKTKMVIGALGQNMKEKRIDAALIVCKKSLISTWLKEISKHSNLRAIDLTGSKATRHKSMLVFAHFYIIGYESLIMELDKISLLLKTRKMAIVLDESHRIKNPQAQATAALFKIKELAKKRIIITGTPVANRPEDLWAQFYFLDDGHTLGTDLKNFEKEYRIEFSNEKKIDERKLIELQEKIRPVSIRRLKKNIAGLELPNKTIIDVSVGLSPIQKKMYDHLRKELYLEFKNASGQTIIDNSENILKRLLRLVQIASNPGLIDPNYRETPDKFKKIDSLVKEMSKNGEKAIIWTNFIENISALKARYEQYKPLCLYGKMDMKERDKSVDYFQKFPEYKLFIANPAAGGVGLTLTAANNAIYLDRNFSLTDYLQSQDRIHRFSQKKDCKIYNLVAKDTIDEYVEELLRIKQEVSSVITGDKNQMRLEKPAITKDRLNEILGEKK